MKKAKHIFTRKTVICNKIIVRQAYKSLPITAEDKIKVMGQDYYNGYTYKKTWPNGDVDIGFGVAEDTGSYRLAMPGEKIVRRAAYDIYGERIN